MSNPSKFLVFVLLISLIGIDLASTERILSQSGLKSKNINQPRVWKGHGLVKVDNRTDHSSEELTKYSLFILSGLWSKSAEQDEEVKIGFEATMSVGRYETKTLCDSRKPRAPLPFPINCQRSGLITRNSDRIKFAILKENGRELASREVTVEDLVERCCTEVALTNSYGEHTYSLFVKLDDPKIVCD